MPLSHNVRETILSGTILAQTARAIMAAFQIGALATNAVVKPLYTKQTWKLMSSSMISKLNAVGMTNLLVFEAVRDCRSKPGVCNLANALTMFGTGAIYVFFPVKGLAINIPFVGSLFSVGIVNVVNFLRNRNRGVSTPKKHASRVFPVSALALMMSGVSSLLFLSNRTPLSSVNHRSMISKVYLSQLSMNTMTAGAMALQSPGKSEISTKHIYLALLGLFCARADMKATAVISMGGAALSAVRVVYHKGKEP